MTAARAYAEVERITRRRARNFAYGIMVLPREKRRAIAAIYAFARRVDDVADGDLPREEKMAQLLELRTSLDRATDEDAMLIALADARARTSRTASACSAPSTVAVRCACPPLRASTAQRWSGSKRAASTSSTVRRICRP